MGSEVEVTAADRQTADKHHAHLLSAARYGSWCTCPCGWSSGIHGTSVGAHLAFGRHLVSVEHGIRHAAGDPT
jgi:hypothetical protein